MKQTLPSKYLVAYFDIFGFSLLTRENIEDDLNKIQKVWSWIKKETDRRNFNAFLFSDCGFILHKIKQNNAKDDLRNFIGFLQLLLDQYLEADYLLRGGISCGNVVHSDNLIIGKPVNEAVKFESKYCPGPFLIFPAFKQKELYSESSFTSILKLEPLLLKGGGKKLYCTVVFPQKKRHYFRLIKQKRRYYLANGPSNYGYFWDSVYIYLTRNFPQYFTGEGSANARF